MAFADRYVSSINSSNLMDDDRHHACDPLAAAALSGDLGSLLCRVKYADGTINKAFEGNPGNLAQLLRIWTAAVTEKGKARKWIPATTAWDMQAAYLLYKRVAEASLAHWLDDKCKCCGGTGNSSTAHRTGYVVCQACKGSGDAVIACSGGFERERIQDMVSELRNLAASHAGRANNLLRNCVYNQ